MLTIKFLILAISTISALGCLVYLAGEDVKGPITKSTILALALFVVSTTTAIIYAGLVGSEGRGY